MFGVVWTNKALDELADIWVTVSPELRDRIESAMQRLDQSLRDDPNTVGESRNQNRRVAFDPPIAIIYQIDYSSQVVVVSHVWQYGK
jgi:hypothetical protein